ncbi:MAG: hypothetical protein MUO50_16385, partial [Longimicrobiales bacterium]|nr:hypothetical protein [Longimicrobiales bacterium]
MPQIRGPYLCPRTLKAQAYRRTHYRHSSLLTKVIQMTHRGILVRVDLTKALACAVVLTPFAFGSAGAQQQERAAPIFENGQAQVVPTFADSSQWIREELWVETEFDSDGDGRLDRVHVAVVRQRQTESEGLKVPVIYESSPYFAGTSGARQFLWDVRQEVGAEPPPRGHQPPPTPRISPGISNSQVETWVPRGFAVVHSEAPGTGLSQGCATVGGP